MKKLFLDTTSNKEVIIRLYIDEKEFEVKQEIAFNRGQVVLPLVDELLKKHSVEPEELDAVEVNAGPGSFTGVRVGVAIANALSFALQIPVNGITIKDNGKLVEPVYSQ